ncbi:phosphatase [Nocardioides sp. Root1257]|uniref:inositol monophosphatase family protein n=1 Tax=unclassified Nocardioides TaxID=2615069 RepID=UPI0006FFA474|nr:MULTISPECIES: inositol monophosphatase family protein [unclassified Nocardioides]KQW53181.1 phosphatase [Nocardioides sp. Root1257]KRC55868.1 phosphatase [Nocardioides sp. Root224]
MSDAELAVAAAEAGAAVVRAHYGAEVERYAKSPTDFATTADIEAERAIVAFLREARPDDAVLGEESGLTGAAARRTWLVDPLCGTLNFAVTTPLIATNVALRVGDRIEAAASADPIAREVFWTDGVGAWCRTPVGDAPLYPSPDSALVEVNLDAVHPDPGRFRPAVLLGHPDFRARYGGRVLSTTLALAWVAAGRRAAYVTDGRFTDNVHFAAGIAICGAAGCVVTDLRGEAVDSPGGSGLLVAADRETHDHLLGLCANSSEGIGKQQV